MSVMMVNSWKKIAAQWILLVIPTAIFFALFAWQLNNFYAVLNNTWFSQGVFFVATLAISVLFYTFRFRFITTVVLLGAIYWIIAKAVNRMDFGEFDTFYFSIKFLIFSIISMLAWLVGYGLARSRTMVFIWAGLILLAEIVMVSKTQEITARGIADAFVPALAYTFYIIYTAELIRNMNEQEDKFAWFIVRRLIGFAVLVLLIFFFMLQFFGSSFQTIEKEWGGGGSKEKGNGKNSESMTDKDSDGGVKNKDQTRLTGSLSKEKQLIFVARLDHFFPDGRTPNPLYFTSDYYTKFDTATQTFETDPKMPYNDLFSPDPSQVPLYFVKQDTTIFTKSLATRNRIIVNAEVYKAVLSPHVYLAPSAAYYCQPISVPREYRDQFKSAYRARMWVSQLNSAYFIYNPADNRELRAFQEQRFELLRKIKTITGPDKKFMDYYTYMPSNEEYRKITKLADSITHDATTPIDKIIALRDYFLGKDEFGQPLFSYSDNPGIPGIPSANKLTYFLFENRKGYCAYYAGATLFMLRSLGIPSRLAAGFSAVDRSQKNPGWYWFYQDQAHAWVQVYFQGYGWIDFDTTVPDRNTQQADQPDGTPPPEMSPTYLVADGVVERVDTVKKLVHMKVEKMIYHDRDFADEKTVDMEADVSIAQITTDTGQVRLSAVVPGMRGTAVSHAEALKDIQPDPVDNISGIVKKLPVPVPIDELKLVTEKKDDKKKSASKDKEASVDWRRVGRNTGIAISVLTILAFLLPTFIWMVLNRRARRSHADPYDVHRAALFYLHQVGIQAYGAAPEVYARKVDTRLGTEYGRFARLYQKHKYSGTRLTEEELQWVRRFYPSFVRTVRQHYQWNHRLMSFFNIFNTFYFFNQSKKQYGVEQSES